MASKRALRNLTHHLEHISSRALPAIPGSRSRMINLQSTSASRIMPRMRQPKRHFTTTLTTRREEPQSGPPHPSGIPASTIYNYADISSLSSSPDPKRILIDVREPSELLATGKIPSSHNIPIKTSPDAFFLPAEEFEDRFGFPRPAEEDEVIFYCKSGVRSKAAARLAGQAGFGGKIGEFPGSWLEWEKNGGQVEK